MAVALGSGYLNANWGAGTNSLEITVSGTDDEILVTARFDNLGKGASGSAVQNMNLMLGFPEETDWHKNMKRGMKYDLYRRGVCAAQGFKAAGIHVGVKTNNKNKKDLALIVADVPCTASAVYTKNTVKAAPLLVTKAHLTDGTARAVLVNSGNANDALPTGGPCGGELQGGGRRPGHQGDRYSRGVHRRHRSGAAGQGHSGRHPGARLAAPSGRFGDAAAAIMTTDTVKKEYAAELAIGGKTVSIGGIAKGSGMIHPNMGTMLCFITTDCAISAPMIKKALLEAVAVSFNRISVDGDTSTTICAPLWPADSPERGDRQRRRRLSGLYRRTQGALHEASHCMASDGEGATHLITCTVAGAGAKGTPKRWQNRSSPPL